MCVCVCGGVCMWLLAICITIACMLCALLTAAAKATAGRVQSNVGILTQQQIMARTIDTARRSWTSLSFAITAIRLGCSTITYTYKQYVDEMQFLQLNINCLLPDDIVFFVDTAAC